MRKVFINGEEFTVFNVKCTFKNGDYFYTDFNAKTAEDVGKYYIGRKFNLGTVADNMQVCTKVEFIYN